MKTFIYNSQYRYSELMSAWHTVASMMQDCQRSRAWAYRMIQRYSRHRVQLLDGRTGRREMAIPRKLVTHYLTTTRRGNPNWRS